MASHKHNSTLAVYGPLEFVDPVMFDLDGTLVRTKSGHTFPRYVSDYEFMPNVVEVLARIQRPIVIITNQGGKNKRLINERLKRIHDELIRIRPDVTMFAAHAYDKYRKPNTGIWDEYISAQCVNPVYIGDALGRDGDFSASDAEFAKNIGAKIVEPEQFFTST